jgi:hypothetical protein
MTSSQLAAPPSRDRNGPKPGDSSSARRLASASISPLSEEEYQKIERFGSQLKVPLKTLEEMRRTTVELREQIAALSYEEPKGLFARCAAWVSTKFGGKDALAPTREQLEQKLSENLRQIRRFTEKVIQPKVNAIRSKYEGKTFERTKDTPRPLVLASVPTEKVGKIPTHEALFAAIERFAQSKEQPAFKIVARDGDNSITISRLNKDNMEETIRLSYRRPGKVDAEIVGPYDVQSGPFWNDDALKLVRAFTAGHNLSVKPAKFKSYTIA